MDIYDLSTHAVLEKELYTSPPLMKVVVAKVLGSRRDIPKAFRLTKEVSTGDLKHLRRIRDLPDDVIECIICKVEQKDLIKTEELLKTLDEKFAPENIFTDYRIAEVPSCAPRTEHQLKACVDIWPCKFAKNNYLIQCMEGSLLNEAEQTVLRVIVNNLLHYIGNNSEHYDSGSVVFRCAKIYGIGLSNHKTVAQHPVKHAAMLSIDSVATQAGSGHWRCSNENNLIKTIQDQLDQREDLNNHRIDAKFLPYLCTNYDVLVTEEPCLMCTMGLVQSRIRRLFYLDAESVEKLTTCKLICYPDKAIEEFLVHRDKNLNHRFEAWKITLNNVDKH